MSDYQFPRPLATYAAPMITMIDHAIDEHQLKFNKPPHTLVLHKASLVKLHEEFVAGHVLLVAKQFGNVFVPCYRDVPMAQCPCTRPEHYDFYLDADLAHQPI